VSRHTRSTTNCLTPKQVCCSASAPCLTAFMLFEDVAHSAESRNHDNMAVLVVFNEVESSRSLRFASGTCPLCVVSRARQTNNLPYNFPSIEDPTTTTLQSLSRRRASLSFPFRCLKMGVVNQQKMIQTPNIWQLMYQRRVESTTSERGMRRTRSLQNNSATLHATSCLP
jgi:hypothetical protein